MYSSIFYSKDRGFKHKKNCIYNVKMLRILPENKQANMRTLRSGKAYALKTL